MLWDLVGQGWWQSPASSSNMSMRPRYPTLAILWAIFALVPYLHDVGRMLRATETSFAHRSSAADGILRDDNNSTLPHVSLGKVRNSSFVKYTNNSTDLLWWKPFVEDSARVFPPWRQEPHSWCLSPEQKNNLGNESYPQGQSVGLLYVKMPKAASSTLRGVTISIAHHVARRKFNGTSVCVNANRHAFAGRKQHARGMRGKPNLLWTFVRHPMSRDISAYYFFQVSRRGADPRNDTAFIETIEQIKPKQTSYLMPSHEHDKLITPSRWLDGQRPESYETRVAAAVKRDIMDFYDFIGVVERNYESLAVMTLLWDLEPTDVIVLSAKNGGKYDDRCNVQIPKPKRLSPRLERYFLGTAHTRNNADYLLYDAAVRSLDLTIEAVGIERVRERATLIQRLQRLAQQECQHKAIFPCSADGVYQPSLSQKDCYANDAGCGHVCVDRVMERYRRGEIVLPAPLFLDE